MQEKFLTDNFEKIRQLNEIKFGDYVVHTENGIGKYLGVETLEFDGLRKDFINIQYSGQDKLFIPIDQIQLLQKYISADGSIPKLSRLGSGEWSHTKARATKAVEDIAEKLLETLARREHSCGFAFAKDDETQKIFEDAFPYEETSDQIRALEEIKKDMEASRPMDRLICGDVGFGKTEIAIRAAYKAVMNQKQCAVLVPTTILAQQHYQTFISRLKGFSPTVDVICRFRSEEEQSVILQRVRAGEIDVLIGTHAILNFNRVQFKNLGLIIIDEEQRFGVKQKEKIREMSDGVDVLTLSATPIPRTLHMSLIGARDISLIETAPSERLPVKTYVIEDDDKIIVEALRREMKREGQIYFIYNNIETIERMRERLTQIVPEARIQTAHGQLSEEFLEQVMMDFYSKKFDILLTTTIVESGLDIANANTILVYDADSFGLAQLYQMRGRVGRSHRMAYAYFIYRKNRILTETAEKRLEAMKKFVQLGSGFKIALKDLEIRGAGNLLGAQQHGHIASVGFEMYCQLLKEAIDKLTRRKIPNAEEIIPTISLPIDIFIDRNYISNATDKIEIYRRLAHSRKISEIRSLHKEIQERFGQTPSPTENLFMVSEIQVIARHLKVSSIKGNNFCIEIIFSDLKNISVQGVLELSRLFHENFKFQEKTKNILLRFETNKNLLSRILNVLRRLIE